MPCFSCAQTSTKRSKVARRHRGLKSAFDHSERVFDNDEEKSDVAERHEILGLLAFLFLFLLNLGFLCDYGRDTD